jgi:hypothetical protein
MKIMNFSSFKFSSKYKQFLHEFPSLYETKSLKNNEKVLIHIVFICNYKYFFKNNCFFRVFKRCKEVIDLLII